MRRTGFAMLAACLFGLFATTAAQALSLAPARGFAFTLMTGDQEVPPVETDGIGFSTFASLGRDRALFFTVFTFNLEDILMAHIHLAPAGENGPIVAFLFASDEPENRDGLLSFGILTEDDLVGPLEGEPLSALLDEIEAGNTYVNVHTVAHPGGEIRGQIHGFFRRR